MFPLSQDTWKIIHDETEKKWVEVVITEHQIQIYAKCIYNFLS